MITMLLLAPWWLIEVLTKASMAVLCKIRFFETSFLLNSGLEVGFRACQSFFPFSLILAKYFALPASLMCAGV